MPKTILVADDEPDILSLMTTLLSKAGYRVIQVVNGREALDRVWDYKPDLVILDYVMPILNGVQVCRKIREEDQLKHIPVLFMTASFGFPEKEVTRSLKSQYMIKPFEVSEFLEKVKSLIEGG